MMTKNLKHGVKCTKTDIVLLTSYMVSVDFKGYMQPFNTKLDAINHITDLLGNPDISKDNIHLFKVQSIKF